MLRYFPEIRVLGCRPSPASKRNQWRENNVFRDLYRRVPYLNHRLGDRSQHAASASAVDWCGNSLYGRSGDSARCNGYSTKGRLVLREFGNCAWLRAALESSSGFRPPRCRLIDEKKERLKKIRYDEGAWTQLELYIKQHTSADFSHGMCEPCTKKMYPEIYEKLRLKDVFKK
jgi:hypothetical protein